MASKIKRDQDMGKNDIPAEDTVEKKSDEQVLSYALQNEDSIERRIEELKTEWSVERFMLASGSILGFWGIVQGLIGKKRWLIVPAVVLPTLLQYSLKGSSPALKAFRRFGLRSQKEIDVELYSLKGLRGDFSGLEADSDEPVELRAVRALKAAKH